MDAVSRQLSAISLKTLKNWSLSRTLLLIAESNIQNFNFWLSTDKPLRTSRQCISSQILKDMAMVPDEIIQSIGQVPMLPTNIRRIMAIINDPQADMNMLARVVEEDPTLTMQALKLCNSAYYSLPVEVTSIAHAVRFLGTETVGGLAMAVYFQGLMQFGKQKKNPWLQGAKTHLLGTGQLAEKLARIAGGIVSPATAFTAGLLHDVGKLVFSKLDITYAYKVHELVREQGLALIDAEGRILGMDHAEAGELLSKKWDMPEIITDAIRNHHAPPSAKFISTLYIYLANELFYLIDQKGDMDAFCNQPINGEVIQEVGLTADQLQSEFFSHDFLTKRTRNHLVK